MFGALLEVELGKICTTPAREKDLEVKIVKTPGARDVFGGSKCFSRGRRRDLDTLQNTWQAQEFVRVAKTLAGLGDLKRVWNDACRDFVLCDVDVRSPRRSIRGRVANFMSRNCYFAGIISRGSYRSSYALAQLFRGRRSTFEASISKSLKRIVILRPSVWSTCRFWRKSRKNASFLNFTTWFLMEVSQKSSFLIFKAWFLKEISQKCFAFDLQSLTFEGSLAEKLRFWASKLDFWRKSLAKTLRFWASKVLHLIWVLVLLIWGPVLMWLICW